MSSRTASLSVARRHHFGTFGGVFTPAILTILGVILFLRADFVVGHAGIRQALLILLLSKSLTFLTGLSIAAISTNTEVKGGGSYFLISRSLGPEFGGSIGLTLWASQALAVPFYVLGFTESVVRIFPALTPHFFTLTLTVAAALFVLAYVGADWALRVEYLVLAVLGASIASFLVGAALRFDPGQFQANLRPNEPATLSFWALFALYFPAVTGIDAGLNMSGDLDEPGKSMPLGTLGAILTGAVIYAAQILLCGGAATRQQLIEAPFETLVRVAPLHLGFLVVAGVFAATLSSAIGSFVGGPRILQALARDNIFPVLGPLGAGSKAGDEPRRALVFTAMIVFAVLYECGNDPSGGAFNLVAAVISMFFLYSYGMINLAAFTEAYTKNPSFRPRFRFFHHLTGLVGAVGCGLAALLINPLAAVAAAAVLGLLYGYVRHSELTVRFGDARRGFYYSRVRNMLLTLRHMPPDPKNWRPTIIALSGNPYTRHALVHYAAWLGGATGIVALVELLRGQFQQTANQRATALHRLEDFIEQHGVEAFADVVVGPDFDEVLPVLLQAHSLRPLKPNLVMFGWPQEAERVEALTRHLRTAATLGMSLLVVRGRDLPTGKREDRRVDLWWRGRRNGSLMLILAHLLVENREWHGARVRILRRITDEEGREPATAALEAMAAAARIEVQVNVVVSVNPFPKVLNRYSHDAACVMLGFGVDMLDDPAVFRRRYTGMTGHLPTTLLVCSSGDADLLA